MFVYQLLFPNGKSFVSRSSDPAEHFLRHRWYASRGATSALYRAWIEIGEPKLIILSEHPDSDIVAATLDAVIRLNTIWPAGYNMPNKSPRNRGPRKKAIVIDRKDAARAERMLRPQTSLAERRARFIERNG